jgi:hypothetical protein
MAIYVHNQLVVNVLIGQDFASNTKSFTNVKVVRHTIQTKKGKPRILLIQRKSARLALGV